MTKEIKFSYEDAPTLQKFAESSAFIRGLMGPFGSGKSSACVIEIIRRALAQEPMADGIRRTRWAVIRNTYPQLNDTTIKTFLEWLPEQHFGRFNKAEHTYTITAFPDAEIEIIFRPLDRPDHVKNLLSLNLTGAWVNEAREVQWEVIKPLMGRVGRFPSIKDCPITWHGLIFDTNPPDPKSWWYELFETNNYSELAAEMEAKKGIKFREVFKQPSGLGPDAENTRFLPPGYYEGLAADPDPDWVKVHVHGEYGFIKSGKPVYPNYADSFHCRKVPFIPGLPIYRGWDYGLTPACILLQLAPNGQLRVIDEYVADRAGIGSFTDLIIRECAVKYPNADYIDIGDPAGQQGISSNAKAETAALTDDITSCFEIQRAKGVDIQPGIQTLELRLESVRYGLANVIENGQPMLVVDEDCAQIRQGFQGGYCYKRILTSGTKYAEKPDKNDYSHPHDALQYICAEILGDIVHGILSNRSSVGTQPLFALNTSDFFHADDTVYADDDFDPFGDN